MNYKEFDEIKIEEVDFFNPPFLKARFYPNNIYTLGDLFRLYETPDFVNIFASSKNDIKNGVYDLMNGNLKLLRYEYLGIDPMLDDLKDSIYFYGLSRDGLRKLGFTDGAIRTFATQTEILHKSGLVQSEQLSVADLITLLHDNSDKLRYGWNIHQTVKNEYQEKIRILYKYLKDSKNKGNIETKENPEEIQLSDTSFIKPVTIKKILNSRGIYTIQDLLECDDDKVRLICSTPKGELKKGLYETMSGTINLLRYKYLGEDPDLDLDKKYIDTNKISDDKNEEILRKLGYTDVGVRIILNNVKNLKDKGQINAEQMSVKDIILSIADYNKYSVSGLHNIAQTCLDEFNVKTSLMIQYLKKKDDSIVIDMNSFAEGTTHEELEVEKARLLQERTQLDTKIASIDQRISSLKKGGTSFGK